MQNSKRDVFVGTQIRKLYRDKQFNRIRSGKDKRSWDDFQLLKVNFVAINKADTYNELL